ncbi:neurofilament heavy polypeptide [Kryptolebias marmoratus]|uniref:Neurofilament heavy polypeptide-like n=1 Tax=Kryptolebias marmoratus TaxID=37003 RepID=A0A3Q3AVX4_KRYMA|nr:neurofilament heavy polypeptide [Kryptolebias marmoratus]
MGSCCCKADYPCGSGEETSVLLKDDSKTTCISEKVAVDTCVLQGDDEMRGADEKAEKPEVKQQTLESSATQENGLLQKENAPVSPRSESEVREDATTAQPEQSGAAPASGGNLPENASTAHGEDVLGPVTKQEPHEEEDPASAQGISPSTEAVRPESPSHTETQNTSTEHTAASISPADGQEGRSEEAKPSGAFAQDDDVLPVPNPELAAAAGQAASVSEVPLETNTEAPGCAVTVGLDDGGSPCKEDGSVETKKHGAFWSFPSGPEPAGLDPSEEKLDSGGCERNTEATSPAAAKSSLSFDKDEKPSPEGSGAVDFKEVTSSEKPKQDAAEETAPDTQDKDVPEMKEDDGLKEEEEGARTETGTTQPKEGPQNQEVTENKDELASDVSANDEPATEEKGSLGNSEEDLYRGAEELSLSQVLKMEDRCSLSPAVDILSYSEREWKGNTAKSTLIKKGYKEMSQTFDGVRRVRGDNYCALRATLFQVLSQSTTVPRWLQEDDVVTLPKQLEAQEGLVSQWRFPEVCVQRDGSGGDAAQQLKGYIELLRNTWQAAVDCPTSAERQKLCERVFQGGEEELGLLEALKLLMLGRAAELHGCMLGGGDVPLFCWLLFARDSSDCPRSFLSNHLRHVGLSAGLEQVEMFLLGYALQHTIQVYRLYKANTEEFITFYPDDHKDDWPSVCLVTEDDRHYNVPVVEAAEPNEELASS